MGDDEGKKKFVYLKWASQFWFSVQNFIFPQRKDFLVLGGWVVWPGGFGWVGPPDHPPPPAPVGKHIPAEAPRHSGLPDMYHFGSWSPNR